MGALRGCLDMEVFISGLTRRNHKVTNTPLLGTLKVSSKITLELLCDNTISLDVPLYEAPRSKYKG